MYNLRRKKEQGIWFILEEIRRHGNIGSGAQSDFHPAEPAACGKERPKELPVPKEQQQRKTYTACDSRRGPGTIPSRQQNLPHGGSGFRVMRNTGVQGLWSLPLWLRKTAEARLVAGESLYRGLKRLLCETVTVKPGLCWRSEDVRDASAVG